MNVHATTAVLPLMLDAVGDAENCSDWGYKPYGLIQRCVYSIDNSLVLFPKLLDDRRRSGRIPAGLLTNRIDEADKSEQADPEACPRESAPPTHTFSSTAQMLRQL